MAWSFNRILSVGLVNGSIIFFYIDTNKQLFTVGKHSSPVVKMVWTSQSPHILLSYSEEKKITISKDNSESHPCTKDQGKYLVNEFHNPIWMEKIEPIGTKTSQNLSYLRGGLNFLVAVNERKALMLINLLSNESPKKIVFNQNYGKIVDFDYLPNGQIIVAFNKGTIVILSLMNENLTGEDDNERIFSSSLDAMKIDKQLNKIYCFGDSQMKVI